MVEREQINLVRIQKDTPAFRNNNKDEKEEKKLDQIFISSNTCFFFSAIYIFVLCVFNLCVALGRVK